jgi:uridine kinase
MAAVAKNGESNGHAAKRQKLDEVVKVHVGGKVVEHPIGISAQDVMDLVLDKGVLAKTVAARLDNVVVPLSQPIVGTTAQLEAVPLASADGIRTLVETLKMMIKIAKHDCTPDLAITVGRPFGASYYCQLHNKTTGAPHLPTAETLSCYRRKMEGLIEAAKPIRYKTVALQDAIDNMAKTGMGFTAKILQDFNMPTINVVECEGMYHMPRAPIVPTTDMISKDSFKLSLFKEGFLLEHFRLSKGEARHYASDVAANEMLWKEYKERSQWAEDVELLTIAQLNTAIREGRSKQVIQAAEANCDRQFVELAAQVKARSSVNLVLIAGPSSSGKTTFAKRLQVQLETLGFKPEVLSVDNFYKGWPDITKEGPHKVDWESLDSLNLEQLNQVLNTLIAGEEALIPEYDMKTSMPAEKSQWKPMKLKSKAKGVIIMEGIHCLNPTLTASVARQQKFHIAIAPIPALQLDAMHVLSSTTIRMLRRMVRDYLNRGRPVLTTLKQWPSIAAGEVNNIYPHQGNADAVMNSDISYEMCVLKAHVEPLLKTVKPSEREYSEVRRILQTLDQFLALPTNVIPPQSLLREFVGGSWYYDHGGWYKSY